MTDKFKLRAKAVFCPYQTFNMCTSKWHAVSHVVDALRHAGVIEYLDAEFYKESQKTFKEKYKHL